MPLYFLSALCFPITIDFSIIQQSAQLNSRISFYLFTNFVSFYNGLNLVCACNYADFRLNIQFQQSVYQNLIFYKNLIVPDHTVLLRNCIQHLYRKLCTFLLRYYSALKTTASYINACPSPHLSVLNSTVSKLQLEI